MKSAPYKMQLRANSGDGQELYSFRSARGVNNARSVNQEEVFLLQLSDIESTDSLLVVDSRIGVEGCIMGKKAKNGRTMMTNSGAREVMVSEFNRRKNNLDSSEVMITSDIYQDCIRKYDKAVYTPKDEPEHLVKQKIYDAIRKLRDHGTLYLVLEKGSDDLKSFTKELGKAEETLKDGMVGLSVEKGDFHGDQNFLEERTFQHRIKGEEVNLETLDGVFSAEQVNMSEMIVRESDPGEDEKVLDANCFFGSTGIFIQKLYGSEVVFTDRDDYFRRYSRKNARENNLEDFSAVSEDGLENFPRGEFDRILYRVRPEIDRSLVRDDFREAFRSLKKGGKFFVCHRKDFGAPGVLKKFFGNYSTERREFDFQLSVSRK
jgi:16S rRNA G1207 methylase RsmC